MLVFLPGEREIRDVGEHLLRELPGVEAPILPSVRGCPGYSEQQRIFQRGRGNRDRARDQRGRDVDDRPGHSLGHRFRTCARHPLQRALTACSGCPIEPMSRASADQRKGRCGRTADGVCIRLYSEEEFDERAALHRP